MQGGTISCVREETLEGERWLAMNFCGDIMQFDYRSCFQVRFTKSTSGRFHMFLGRLFDDVFVKCGPNFVT